MAKISKVLSGVAGQHFVAAELSRLGYIATVTLRNTKGIDVLAANEAGTKAVSIQVKTNQNSDPTWLLDAKCDSMAAADLFYVFVNLNAQGAPSYHVVESKIVADATAAGHKAWLSKPKRNGQPRKNTSMRVFNDPAGQYLNAWSRLGLG